MNPKIRESLYEIMDVVSPSCGLSRICIQDSPDTQGIGRRGMFNYREFWSADETIHFLASEVMAFPGCRMSSGQREMIHRIIDVAFQVE